MASTSYSFIRDLKLTASDDESCKKCPKIKVRVTRLCPAYNNPTKKQLLSFVSMVLIDERGHYIYAEIPPALWSDFRTELIDDDIYILSRFRVINNKKKFRVVNEPKLMIEFIYDTYVRATKEKESIIPIHKFDFLEFTNIDARRDDDGTLTDLIGVFVNDYIKEKYFAIEIEDNGGHRVRVALWDACIKDFKNQREKLETNGSPLIITLTSLRVKSYNGYTSLTTSSSSRVYINLHIPEMVELMEHRSGISLTPIERTVQDIPTKDIPSILEHCKTEYKQDLICYCVAEVKDIISERSWKYSSCTTCNTKPQYINESFFCDKCQKKVEAQTIRYRIDLKVEDKDCTTIFVVFDEDAKKYIGQDAVSLYDEAQHAKVKISENSSRVPKRIHTTFVGTKFLFKIKIKAINHDVTKKSRFGIIDMSDKNVQEDVSSSKIPSLVHKRPHSVIELEDEDDVPISQLSKKAIRVTSLKKGQSKIKGNTTKSEAVKSKRMTSRSHTNKQG